MAAISDLRDYQDSSSRDWRLRYPDVTSGVSSITDPGAIRFKGATAQWMMDVAERLAELLQLEPEWDPRGSQPVSHADVTDAIWFLTRVMRDDTRAPWIAPLASGGVELAWRAGNIEVEAVFDRARDEQELVVCVGDNESDAPIDQAESLFATVVDRLAAEDAVAV